MLVLLATNSKAMSGTTVESSKYFIRYTTPSIYTWHSVRTELSRLCLSVASFTLKRFTSIALS